MSREAEFETYHSGELRITAVGTRLAVSTKTSNFGEIEGKLVLKPVNSVTRAASEHTNQVIAGKVAGLRK
jgi:hypothetical protein